MDWRIRLSSSTHNRCVDKDDTNPTIDKIAAADMILFATPVYWWRAIWYKVAISLSENLLITVFKFMHILRLLFQSVVILPKMELHSNFV
jgi:prephenate dehydrogenase